MTSAIHGDARSTATSATSAVVTSSLSAVVSRKAPRRVVTPQRRARRPSIQSVAAATKKTAAAAVSDPARTSAITTGASRIRTPVPAASSREERRTLTVPASTGARVPQDAVPNGTVDGRAATARCATFRSARPRRHFAQSTVGHSPAATSRTASSPATDHPSPPDHRRTPHRWPAPRREDIMKALVYHGPGEKSWTDAPDPQIQKPDRHHRQDRHDDDLRHRPAHPQGRRARRSRPAGSSATRASASSPRSAAR